MSGNGVTQFPRVKAYEAPAISNHGSYLEQNSLWVAEERGILLPVEPDARQ
jgi:hypothetical protein